MFAMLENLAEESKTLANGSFDDIQSLPAIVDYLPVHAIKTKLFNEYFPDLTIVDLATRAWWHRAWTVQELMLSKKSILMMGKYTITWENCFAAVDHGLRMQLWGHVFLGFIVNPVIIPYISMRALMNRYRLVDQQRSPAVDLLRLLIHCRHRDSRDPRDKIYAVLGILRDIHPETLKSDASDAPNVEVGYQRDVREVYRSMSQELILKTNTLDSLGVCPETELDLPSWATDWSCTDRIGSPLMQDSLERMRITHATKYTKANAHFSIDGTRLILRGFEVTTIVALSDTLPVPDLDNVAGSKASLKHGKKSRTQLPDFESLIPEANSSPDFDSMTARAESNLAKARISVATYTDMVKGFYAWLRTRLFSNLQLYTVIFFYLVELCIKPLGWRYKSLDKDCRAIMSVFHTLFTWEQFAASQKPTNEGIEPEDVYWHTLCGGTYKNLDPVKTKVIFEHWYNVLEPLRSFVRNFRWISRIFPWIGIAVYMRATWETYGDFWPFIVASQHRRMGRTENGWLGMMPGHAKVGDVVILASGGRVPLVMRKKETEVDGVQEKRALFIGEAYIQGIMDGEMWDEQRCEDIEIW
ncbi:Heterokaryon incompatibility protein [Rutstroemia sp. NJR-2017a WRK4]|nr:Heterokaryon incompatibility protein [Rutstroemia sp. NJR-2017a WRK4]